LAGLLVGSALAMAAPSGAAASGFSFGVAAGEVTSSSAKLWGRANNPGIEVLKVATDPGLHHVAQLKFALATPLTDFTVQRTAYGLRPNTRYWYRWIRFGHGDASAIGTFVTAPGRNDNATIRFAWSGDTDATPGVGQTQPFWNNFDIFKRMQEEGNQFNVHLGDTIYSDSEVPGRLNPIALTVSQKWAKYRLNLGQAKLASLRGSAGFYSQWDDHEFINDFSRFENSFRAGTPPQTVNVNGQLEYVRGVKAFIDYAPVDYSLHDGLYRTRRWGKNLELFFLDERSFRSAKASANGVCDNPISHAPDLAPAAPQAVRNVFAALVPSLAQPVSAACLAAINSPNRTFLGQRQLEKFLYDIRHSDARFKVIINEMPIQKLYVSPYDFWEGYEFERQRVLRALQGVKNTIFLTTDVHGTLVNDARFKTLETGGPVNSGIMDVTVGSAATANYAREIDEATGIPGAGGLVDNLFFEPQPPGGLGMRCSILDQFSYGEVSVTSSQLRITPKNINGAPLTSDDGPCGPFVLNFQP
jgi:phosphodiesterase/alkaline phosphatase D-like protein